MASDSSIPRFQAQLEHIEGRSVLAMPRQDWKDWNAHEGSPVQIDISQTPMSAVAQSASVVAAFAVRTSASTNQIHIFRYDPPDTPNPYNLDKYSVWDNLQEHREYSQLVKDASVRDSEELQAYVDDHVFIVKEAHGEDHWLPALPASALAVLNRA